MTDPVVVNTVSNFTVSVEVISTALGFVIKESFLHDQVKITMTVRRKQILRILTKLLNYLLAWARAAILNVVPGTARMV